MEMKTIDLKKNKLSLKKIISMMGTGTVIIITEGNTPVARLVPAGTRVAGLHLGAITTSSDFDESLPDDFWTKSK